MKKALLLVLVAGCGGDAVEIDQLGAELASAGCAKQFECCTDAEIMELYMGVTIDDMPITTEEQCTDFANALLTGFLVEGYKASIAKGRISYDAGNAGGCIQALRDVACADYANAANLDDCEAYITPLVDEGGACSQDYECTTDYCEGAMNPLGGDPVDGVCARLPGAGEACDDDCAPGFFCDFDTTSGMETCVAVKPNGEECFVDEDCASDYCDDANVCAEPVIVCTGR